MRIPVSTALSAPSECIPHLAETFVFYLYVLILRKCHLVSVAWEFAYITVLRLTEPTIRNYSRYQANILAMMMLLKVVGAAYEIHLTNREKIKKAHKDTYSDYADEEPMDPSFTDLFHFVFSVIGIIVGPHMRLRTYQDYYHLPFSRSCNSLALIQKVLFKVVLIFIVTTIIKRLSPLDYVLTEEFAERSFIYKCIFNALHSTRYRMCIAGYIFLLGQLLSALFGLGAYPTSLKSVTCHGPTVDYSHLKNITKEEADKLEYDFGTCEPVDQFNILFSPWMSQYWKSWNKGVQYFLARYIHTELLENVIGPYYRPILTMLISTYWHGLELGWYIGLAVCGLHVVAEKPYHKIEKYITGWKSNAFVVMMWIVNTFIFHQTMMSSAILEGNAALTHVAAMKYIPFIILLIYFIVGKLTLAHLQRNDALKKNTIIN